MYIHKLHFFDSNGYNLNFEWNKPDVASTILLDNKKDDEQKDKELKKAECYWEGTIYLPKVSVGLYANTSIYILEKYDSPDIENNLLTNQFSFPIALNSNDKITFSWDRLNEFVDEFFMFDFDDTYVIQETSALVYTPNDGPDCNTLIINKFDTYEVPLSEEYDRKALPVHIAFMANERYDATTYCRTLIMSHNGSTIARIKFYAETVEEDERLKIWNQNLGYNITPEDTMLFYKSDIKEYMPDYILLNEKRKELMLEGSNIYPYIGSYLAIINVIKFFGYDNLNIIEYWRNVNPDDENFGKIYHSSKYSLKKKETLTIGARNIVLPNKDYKKINALALVYSINKPTGEIDEWELPKVKEQFTYTIEEALIKLFGLRKKLNKEFMPGSSRIIDIIGEANYFGVHGITKIHETSIIDITDDKELDVNFDVYPKKYVHISDNEYFNRYINIKKYSETDSIPLQNQMISDIENNIVDSYSGESGYYLEHPENIMSSLSNLERCEYYKNYYKDTFEDFTVYKVIMNNDAYPFDYVDNDNEEYDYYSNPRERFSAKVVLECTNLYDFTFENCELKFDCVNNQYTLDNIEHPLGLYPDDSDYNPTVFNLDGEDLTFDNVSDLQKSKSISWKVVMSDNQIDEDLKNVGIYKAYEQKEFEINLGSFANETAADIDKYHKFFIELPYIGYYDVTMEITEGDKSFKKTKKKCIKVEPYHIDMLGFYYDIRELPKEIKYDTTNEGAMFQFIKDNIEKMYGWAVSERTNIPYPTDMSVPVYSYDGNMVNTGPYYNENTEDEWYLADNLTYEMSRLDPLLKYTRYIKSGVDVKPYTWFLLGYEFSKISGKIKPHWTIVNNNTNVKNEFDGRYLTLLLKKEGNYTVKLKLEDKLGNVYTISRNIIVVSKSANYKLYQSFKKDYDFISEQELLSETQYLNELMSQSQQKKNETNADVYVDIIGTIYLTPDEVPVDVVGDITLTPDEIPVNVIGTITLTPDEIPVDVEGDITLTPDSDEVPVDVVGDITLTPDEVPVNVIGTITLTPDEIPVNVEGTITLTPDEVPVNVVGNITLTPDEVPVNVVGNITLTPDEVPVNVVGNITLTPDEIPVDVEGDITYEDENVEISALPIVQCGRKYPSGFDVSTETNTFPIVVSNDKNKPTTYTLNVDNYRSSNSFAKQATIDIGNGQSVFVIYKPGYSPSQSGSNRGTFSIHCDDASNDITLQITSTTMTDHGPSIRCNNTSNVFSNVHLIPYSNENVSIDITLLGATQCARIDTSTNTIYSYGDGADMDDTPTESFTYKCYEGYRYLVYKNGKYVPTLVSYDTESMISDLQFNFDETNPRLYSHFNIDIAPNTESRLKFGVVYLGKDVSNPNNDDTGCIYLDSLIQESENIRFVLPISERNSTYIINNLTYLNTTLETIDLSQHNTTYTFSSYSELFFMNSDIVNKITVTDMSNNEIQPTTMTSYGYPYKYGVSYILENNTGYIITIK